ncbi:MAG: hypothetical protein IPM83_16395 [Ignavibacteria bacterium]|nr:hypothetical protein [Ignavibacteria bacterium]
MPERYNAWSGWEPAFDMHRPGSSKRSDGYRGNTRLHRFTISAMIVAAFALAPPPDNSERTSFIA